ncbi:hypothetical protein AB5N19_14402 [Seiridium cardinale]|uniref:Uncharacterized protein n=1 Tax=Seiridium cardinale TaxID=138064 RepID=A0ABR2Y9T6_9PEZI
MRPFRASKAVFIMVNHILAEHHPMVVVPARIYGRGHSTYDAGLSPRQDLLTEDIPSINIWAYKDKCDCKQDCPKTQIQDPKDCQKCAACLNGQKPNTDQTQCVKDDCATCGKGEIRDSKDCKKCVNKDKRFEEKKTNINNRRNQVVRERKNRNFDKTKDKMQKKYNDKDPVRRRKKNRRMSRCAALVPLSMGGLFASEVDELFDEEWAESDEMMAFWPPELTVKQVDEWVEDQDDSFLEGEDYLHKWMEAGRNKPNVQWDGPYLPPEGGEGGSVNKDFKRDTETNDRGRAIVISARKAVDHFNVPQKFVRDYSGESPMATTTDLVARNPHPPTALSTHVDKRCPPCLVPIFAAILRTISVVAQMATRVGLRFVGKYYKEGIRVAKGRNKVPKEKQRGKAKEMSKDGNWRRCLEGLDPM